MICMVVMLRGVRPKKLSRRAEEGDLLGRKTKEVNLTLSLKDKLYNFVRSYARNVLYSSALIFAKLFCTTCLGHMKVVLKTVS